MAKNTSILLGDHFEAFISQQVESGEYASASEVVREALRHMESEKRKEEALLAALDAGTASKRAKAGTFKRVRAKHGIGG